MNRDAVWSPVSYSYSRIGEQKDWSKLNDEEDALAFLQTYCTKMSSNSFEGIPVMDLGRAVETLERRK